MWYVIRPTGRRYATRVVIAGMSAAVVCASATQFLLPAVRPAAYEVAEMAAIIASPTTVGFADSQLYGETTAQIDANLELLKSTGSTTVRIDIPWAGVEPLPGQYNWTEVDAIVSAATADGLAIDADLNSTPYYATISGTPPVNGAPGNPAQFGAFAGQVAARYGTQISAYEIYNEVNSQTAFQANNPALVYTQLLQAAYPAIKAADPSATVVAGALASVIDFGSITINPVEFLTDVYADGGKGYFDAVSFHPYSNTLEFSQGANVPNSALQQLTALRALLVANGDSNKLIWATEYGLPTSVVSQQTQATYISDFLNAYSALSYVGPSFIYTVQQTTAANTTDPSDTYGVFNLDGTPTPAELVIQQFIATHPGTVVTPPVTPPVNAFAAAVAAFYQQIIRAYLTAYFTALANAFASLGQPAATNPQVVTAAAAVKPTLVTAATIPATTPTTPATASAAPVGIPAHPLTHTGSPTTTTAPAAVHATTPSPARTTPTTTSDPTKTAGETTTAGGATTAGGKHTPSTDTASTTAAATGTAAKTVLTGAGPVNTSTTKTGPAAAGSGGPTHASRTPKRP